VKNSNVSKYISFWKPGKSNFYFFRFFQKIYYSATFQLQFVQYLVQFYILYGFTFGTVLQLLKSADFNLCQLVYIFQHTHPKNLFWNPEGLIFGVQVTFGAELV
jgi:hypothetical protein